MKIQFEDRATFAVIFLFLTMGLFLGSATAVHAYQIPSKAADVEDAPTASEITATALMHARNFLRRTYFESITQQDTVDYLERIMHLEGADARLSFPTLVMSGSELSQAHGNPYDDDTHVISPASEPVVMIDMGCRVNGHCADVTRTYFFEDATTEQLDAYEAVVAAEEAIIDAITPGVTVGDLDDIHTAMLSDYIGLPGISVLYYWGHALGDWVHEQPYLGAINAGEVIAEGMVLAIEPGIYSDAGWAVRVEDTVLVTSTGASVLSSGMPTAVENVTIASDDPYTTATAVISGYEYGSSAVVSFSIDDSLERVPSAVQYFNGFSWTYMTELDLNLFQLTYFIDYSISGLTYAAFQVYVGAEEIYFFEELLASPDEPIPYVLDPIIEADWAGEGSLVPLSWSVEHPEASMIRVHFDALISPVWEQFSIVDSSGRIVIEYKDVNLRDFWSPWVSGDEVTILAYPTESSAMDPFSFEIDSYETVGGSVLPPTTTTTSTTTTTTTVTSWTPPTTSTTTNNLPEEIDLMLVFGGAAVLLLVLVVVVIGRDMKG